MSYHPYQREVETICSSLTTLPELDGIEVLKSTVRAERGTFMIAVVIDRESGVDTDVCAAVAQSIERRLEALPPPVPLFHLEVSSAGLARPLLKPDDYRRFSGREINVITTLRIRNRTEFTGTIAHADDNAVTLDDRYAGRTAIPYQVIKRANVVYRPEADLKKRKKQH